MEEIFVSYDVAQGLKEIGFDRKCMAVYDYYCMFHIINSNDKFSLNKDEIFCYVPTYEQVFQWFREEGLFGFANKRISQNKYFYEIEVIGNDCIIGSKQYNTYEETREDLILKLIEIYQNEQ